MVFVPKPRTKIVETDSPINSETFSKRENAGTRRIAFLIWKH